jgi:hypothetical protein
MIDHRSAAGGLHVARELELCVEIAGAFQLLGGLFHGQSIQ